MERTSSSDDGAIRPDRSEALREVAAWLLRPVNQSGQDRELLICAAEAAYVRLRTRLALSLGQLGFDMLWARAIQRALLDVSPSPISRAAAPLSADAPGLR